LPDAAEAAARLRRCLQTVFETYYSFDLELLKKQTIGQAIKELQKCNGICPFAIAYATQHGLGGHAIPLNRGALGALLVLGIISESESKAPRVPGLERAISKSKGVEFGSLLHQLGADFYASPFSARLRAVLLEIDPDSKQRLPKRAGKKAETVEAVEEVENGGCEAAPAETSVEAVPAPSDAPAPPLEPTISEPAKSGGKPKKKNASPPETDSADSGKNKPPTKRIAQRKPR
jgi:endonuclease-3